MIVSARLSQSDTVSVDSIELLFIISTCPPCLPVYLNPIIVPKLFMRSPLINDCEERSQSRTTRRRRDDAVDMRGRIFVRNNNPFALGVGIHGLWIDGTEKVKPKRAHRRCTRPMMSLSVWCPQINCGWLRRGHDR